MTNIFIDTCVFTQENYLEGKKINSLLMLFEKGLFHGIMPLITVNEIKTQYRRRATEAIEMHRQFIKAKEVRLLRNHPAGEKALMYLPKVAELSDHFNAEFDKRLALSNIEILPYPTVDISDIFEKYFAGKKPFATAGKKTHEFPDAFAMETIISWCEKNNKPCTVLSKDNDILGISHPLIQIRSDYDEFLSQALKEQLQRDRLQLLSEIYEEQKDSLKSEVADWLRDKLSDITLYYDATNWLEVYDIQVISVEVDFESFKVMKIGDAAIEIEISSDAFFIVDVTTDDENSAYRDDDDKQVYFRDTIDLRVERTLSLPITVSFHIVDEEDYDTPEIEEINGGRDIEIPRTSHHH